MRVVDTSVWIETLAGSAFGRELQTDLPSDGKWIMPTIVQLEVSKWLLRERSEDIHNEVIAFSMTHRIVPLDTAVALEAATLCKSFKLATADAIVWATARLHQADLLTCDAHFAGLPGVIYRAKPAAK